MIALKAAVIYVVLANMQIFTLDYFLGQSEAQPISAPKIDWLFFLFAISFGPFFEELLARGYLLEAFLRRRQLIPGALFVSVIFALAHYPMVLAAISVRLAVDLFTYLAQEHQKF